MNTLLQDIRFGARLLMKHRGFTFIAVIALAFGVGANTSMFSFADAILYRPLPFPDLDRLVVASAKLQDTSWDSPISPADFFEWKRDSKSFASLTASNSDSMNLTGIGEPQELQVYRTFPDFFDVLGSTAMLGRTFASDDGQTGRDRIAILSYKLWQQSFAASSKIVGTSIQLNGQNYEVIGVMPLDFRYPPAADLFLPLVLDAKQTASRSNFMLDPVARLKPGVSLKEADAEIRAFAQHAATQFPDTHRHRTADVQLLRERASGDLTTKFTKMLLGAVLFVLLIACANVANLQFARVAARSKELAVRRALGASRLRLIRQFLTESVLIALAGGILGIVLASWSLDAAIAGMPPEVERFVPGWHHLGINTRVLVYTLIASVGAGVLAGILPAWFAAGGGVQDALKETGRGMSASRSRQRARSALVLCELVLAVVLVVGAGLMVNGVQRMHEPGPNIDASRVLRFGLSLPTRKYADAKAWSAFDSNALDALRSIPGVGEIALASSIPYGGSSNNPVVTIDGLPVSAGAQQPRVLRDRVSADYFKLLRIPLRTGRLFDGRDGPDSPRVAMVSDRLAQLYFPGQNPIGKRIKFGKAEAQQPWMTVVGVVGDLRQDPTDREFRPTLYTPFQQDAGRDTQVLMRASGNPLALVSAARARIALLDPDQPLSEIMTLSKTFSNQLAGFYQVAKMMAESGIIALFLAAIGIYGVMSYSVAERTPEIGLRMALGAQNKNVFWMVARWGLTLTATGLACGLALAVVMARMLASLLFGVSALDGFSFAAGILTLSLAAALACYIPVRRAVRVDPIVTLRTE